MTKPDGKITLLTGDYRGTGLATMRQLGRRGIAVVVGSLEEGSSRFEVGSGRAGLGWRTVPR